MDQKLTVEEGTKVRGAQFQSAVGSRFISRSSYDSARGEKKADRRHSEAGGDRFAHHPN